MNTVTIDFSEAVGRMKVMHAVNNGPIKELDTQTRGNFTEYKAARIPYARTHDASFCAEYGGEHTVDVDNIFRDFDADPDDPASYDFTLTDEYLETMIEAGTEPFYRLGARIERESKQYHTLPPKDFRKWAVICEHIIRHYTEGWADGRHWKITYWEIWNEPDLRDDNDTTGIKATWGGTEAQFYEFYEIASKHLKECFPDLKIGGPALAWQYNTGWLDRFLRYMREHKVPMDFFSWHRYHDHPAFIGEVARLIRRKLDENGYADAESILNEWNYLESWRGRFKKTLKHLSSMHGAAFVSSCMTVAQNAPVDMLMYYDACPSCEFCGMFDSDTFEPLKAYYPFTVFADLYALKEQVSAGTDSDELYVLAASDGKQHAAMITRYLAEAELRDDLMPVKIVLKGVDPASEITVSVLDETHTLEEHTFCLRDGAFTTAMTPASMIKVEIVG